MARNIDQRISDARAYLAAGNVGGYARVMAANIRSALSDKAAGRFRRAVREDGAEGAFANFHDDARIVARGA